MFLVDWPNSAWFLSNPRNIRSVWAIELAEHNDEIDLRSVQFQYSTERQPILIEMKIDRFILRKCQNPFVFSIPFIYVKWIYLFHRLLPVFPVHWNWEKVMWINTFFLWYTNNFCIFFVDTFWPAGCFKVQTNYILKRHAIFYKLFNTINRKKQTSETQNSLWDDVIGRWWALTRI